MTPAALDTAYLEYPTKVILDVHWGSRVHGTATPTSDDDRRRVIVPPKAFFLGFNRRINIRRTEPPEDVITYHIQNYFELLASMDITSGVLETLWLQPQDYVVLTEEGQEIINNRQSFLSQRIRESARKYLENWLPVVRTGRTKAAMHAVRVMRLAKEVLTEEHVIVRRPDAEELSAIRHGAWTVDDTVKYLLRSCGELQGVPSRLPQEPDVANLDKLCASIVEHVILTV